jgi:hypothetical protein
MNYKNVSLPYPVLGIHDDVYPLLEEGCVQMADPVKTAVDYTFGIDLTQRNRDITDLVAEGKAEYACEVTCKDTFLRRCYHSKEPHFDITLDRKEVNGHIDFLCFIAAKVDILGYTNRDFNEDYYGFTFDLEMGDMLAVFPQAWWNTEIKFDKLYAAGSFMQIVEAADGIDYTWFNLDADRIMIEMPHDLFVQYQRIGNSFPDVIHSSLVHNALVYALCNLGEYQDKGKLWADSLMARMADPQLQQYDLSDMTQVYRVADILLRDPYKRLLDSLEKIADSHNEEQED